MSLSELLQREPDGETLQLWLQKAPYAAYLGIRAEVHGNELLFVLPQDEKCIGNPTLPALHGGVTGALLECAAIATVIAEVDTAELPKIVNLAIDYLRPGRPLDTFARGRITRQGRRVVNVQVQAWQQRPEVPIATASAHFLIA